jgi:hypothetical protein
MAGTNKRREPITRLIEQSSLGTPDARAARASVPRAVAQRIVAASSTATQQSGQQSGHRDVVAGRFTPDRVVRGKTSRRSEG